MSMGLCTSCGWPTGFAQNECMECYLERLRAALAVPVSKPTCDCGGAKARTTHSAWCSTATP